jgi:hypothetical protein
MLRIAWVVWSGYGFIVGLVVFMDSLIAELLTRYFTKDDDFYQKNYIPLGCSCFVSAGFIFLLTKYFENKKRENKGTRVFDKVTLAQKSHFFFIPFAYWTYILVGIGVLFIIAQLRNA